MSLTFLTSYILIWPIISLAVLAVIVGATVRDYLHSKRTGRDIV